MYNNTEYSKQQEGHMKEYNKLHSGELYLPNDDEIVKEQTACL